MNSFYLVALIHWFPNGKDLQEEDSRMSSPWKLHVVNTARCYKGQMNTQKCPGSPSHSSVVLVYSGKWMHLSSVQFWETSRGWEELPGGQHSANPQKRPFQEGWESFRGWKSSAPLLWKCLPPWIYWPLVSRTLNIYISGFPGWHVGFQLLTITEMKALAMLSGMGFVDVSRSLLPDKVVFSPYITITFIFIILIFQDCFLRSVRTTSSSIFSLNWLRYRKTLIKEKRHQHNCSE